jgi:sugar (pentulose or hexulose) kinase
MNGEKHVSDIFYMTTLAGYVHWRLTGQKVLGIGDASGIFPINDYTRQYDSRMLKEFDGLVSGEGFELKLINILPKVLLAGTDAGKLTQEGAKLLDSSGSLMDAIPMCPPEGDVGTCMVATDSVKKRSGNMSAGTSVYAMAVLERPMLTVHPNVDIVTTPAGDPVAMVHCDKSPNDLDAWANNFTKTSLTPGEKLNPNELYDMLCDKVFEGASQVNIEIISDGHITGFPQECPEFMYLSNSKPALENFIRNHFSSSLVSLKNGMAMLLNEKVELDTVVGRGIFFEACAIGPKIIANALGMPVKVMTAPAKGGPWGMAVLAAYTKNNKGESLTDYLFGVFADTEWVIVQPDAEGVEYKAEAY